MLFILLCVKKYEKEHNNKYITTDIFQKGSALRVSSLYPVQIYKIYSYIIVAPLVHQHFLKCHVTVIARTSTVSLGQNKKWKLGKS